MRTFKLLLAFILSLMTCAVDVCATDLVIDEYMSTFNGQCSYNVLMTNENVWRWTTAKTPNTESQEYPQWGARSRSIYPMAVTSDESVAEGSVRVTVDCSFKMERSYYPFCEVTAKVGDTYLYAEGQNDYNVRITSSNYATVDATIVFVSYGLVSGPVSVAVNQNNSERDGTFTLKSIKVERTDLVPPTVVSDQPNPAEADYTLTVTNNDPEAELYWTLYQGNPYYGGYTPNAITSGFTKTYDNESQNSFYAYTKREGFYSAFVGGTYKKQVVRNIRYSRDNGYFLQNTLPSSVKITCDDLREGDILYYQKMFKTEWEAITSGTTVYISSDDLYWDSYYPSAVRISTKVVNSSGMETELKNLYLNVVSIPDISFNGFSNTDHWTEYEFDGPQEMTLNFSSYPVEGLHIMYSYANDDWHNYNPNNKPVISSTTLVWGRLVYDSTGDVARSAGFNYIINPAHVTGSCLYHNYSDMPFDVTIGCSSFVNTYVAYTIDGSDPRTSTTAVEVRGEEQTLHIAESCVLRMVVNSNGHWGNVIERTMSIQLPQPMFHMKKSHLVSYGNGDIGTEYDWLHNETALSQKQYPYYSVYYDDKIGTFYYTGTTWFFGKRGQLGECTFDVNGEVDTNGDNDLDTHYSTHMVLTVLDEWNTHDSIDFNRDDQLVFTTYEADGCTWQTDENGRKYLLVPQGATITVTAPEGTNLAGVFLYGADDEENISHLRQTIEGCYVSQVPINEWYCKWIGRQHSVTFVAEAEQCIYGIESFYYLPPSEIYVSFNQWEVIEGRTIQPDYVDNPHSLPIRYSSSDTSVAIVDANTGIVTGVTVGVCTITAEFAGNGVYAPYKESFEIQVIPEVATFKFMGQELKGVQDTLTGEAGGGTWTFSWEEEEVQEIGGGEVWLSSVSSASRNSGQVTVVKIPVLTLNNVNLSYDGEGSAIELNDFNECRIRLIGENSITMDNGCPPISVGTFNTSNSRGASLLITDKDGEWENEGGGGYEPVSAPIRRMKRMSKGEDSIAKLTLAGGPMGIYVCNGSLFMADCEIDACGTIYGVYFRDYEDQQEGSGEVMAPMRKSPKKVLPTAYWDKYFSMNDNVKLKLQGDEAAMWGQFSNYYLQFNSDVELKYSDLSNAQFNYYWDNDGKIYSFMVYDNDKEEYNYAKVLLFGNDYFIAKTSEGVKMKFMVIDEDAKTCLVYGSYDMTNNYGNPAIDSYYSGSVTIPSEVEGYQVVGIADFAFLGCRLSSLSIPASITSIGEVAFMGCNNLMSVTSYMPVPPALPIQTIDGSDYGVFYQINENAVLYVAQENVEAYEGSSWSDYFTIKPLGTEGFVFTAKTAEDVELTFLVVCADEEDGYFVQVGTNDVSSVVSTPKGWNGKLTIPANVICESTGKEYHVVGIGDYAFAQMYGLVSVSIPEGVVYIGNGQSGWGAFESSSLETAYLPGTIEHIDHWAFCTENLKDVYLYAEDVPSLGDSPFNSSTAILHVPVGTKNIYDVSSLAQYFDNGERIVEMGDDAVGDINGDAAITIADVTALVDIILGKTSAGNSSAADVNDDGSVTIADVTALVDIILGK